jgi:hypothetical protein
MTKSKLVRTDLDQWRATLPGMIQLALLPVRPVRPWRPRPFPTMRLPRPFPRRRLSGMGLTGLTPTPRCRKNVSGNIGIYSSFDRSETVAGVE